MADLATLGIAVDSSQAEKGAINLQKLSGAARVAEQATKGVSSGAHAAAQANAAVASSANVAASALTKQASAARMAAAAVNDNVRRMGGGFSGLAAQVQDIGVTAAMGMNPLLIALQQGTQIAGAMEMALQNGGSAAGVFGAALRSLISPVSLIAIGLTAILAAGLQMVDWAGVAAGAMNALASVLETIAPYATMAAAGLALLYAPAIIGGIVSVIALLGRMAVAAVTAAAAMAAANPAGAFVLGVTAAVAAANIFREELTQIFGVDIVGAAKTGANFVIGSFVAAFEDLKFVWNQFPNIVGAAAVGAANAAISAMETMINAASGMLNNLISSVNGALSKLPGGFRIGEIGTVDFGQVANPYADALSGAVGDRNAAVQDALSRDYLGEVGTAISNGASAASEKLRELAGWMGTTEEATKKAGKAANDAADGWRHYGREAARAAQEVISFAQDTARGFMDDLRSGLEEGKGIWRSFADAALNALDKIASKLIDMATDSLISNVLGSLLGGSFLSPRAWGAIQAGGGGLYADGGYTGSGGKYEPAGVVHKGEYVFSAAAVRALGVRNLDRVHSRAKGYASGGYAGPGLPRLQSPANENSGGGVEVSVGVTVDDDGKLQAYVKRIDQVERGQAKMNAELDARVIKTVRSIPSKNIRV